MGAPPKRARKVRKQEEFDLGKLREALTPPRETTSAYAWSLEEIVNARNAQITGQFSLPVRAATAMCTDDAIGVAHENRLDPLRCLDVELEPAKGARGAKIADEAEGLYGADGIGIEEDTVGDIHATLVVHGLAVGHNTAVVRDDGSRIDLILKPWPLEHVRWNSATRSLVTQVEGGPEETITHGDGRWVVFAKHRLEPWKKSAALMQTLLVWARHAFATQDWAKGSKAHGSAKAVANLPLGVALQGKDGKMSAEAKAMIELLKLLVTGDLPIGVAPAGSDVKFLANMSTAWNVWDALVSNAERAAARIYLGTDGMLGAKGGAPGVDLQMLFGVATTKVQGDVSTIERGILTGSVEPWAALNFGDSTLAPRRLYKLPDPDAAVRLETVSKKRMAFFGDIEKTRSNGFEITQQYIDATAKKYEVDAPTLTKAPTIMLPAAEIARVLSVNEARASAGCDPLVLEDGSPDPDGKLTLEQFAAKKAAEVAQPAPAPAPAPAAASLRAEPALSFAERSAAFLADLKDHKTTGLVVDQARVAELALLHDVPVPTIEKAS